ncbi:hypothetical protein [Bhargavaea massiliensis]|uniref:hypothetical protein n=1 Tax=Bhargavaea massiliensis TaxID=2697500 RepID=UPI001BD030D0|nr:hypothetical protein [Bhargavaea massiliensis]
MIRILLVIGVIGFLVSAITLEAWSGGERARNRFDGESEASKEVRAKVTLFSAICGFVAFGAAAFMYFL